MSDRNPVSKYAYRDAEQSPAEHGDSRAKDDVIAVRVSDETADTTHSRQHAARTAKIGWTDVSGYLFGTGVPMLFLTFLAGLFAFNSAVMGLWTALFAAVCFTFGCYVLVSPYMGDRDLQ